jgi:hypothetical protein
VGLQARPVAEAAADADVVAVALEADHAAHGFQPDPEVRVALLEYRQARRQPVGCEGLDRRHRQQAFVRSAQAHVVDVNRLADVLDGVIAEILELERQLLRDMLVNVGGNADAAGLGQGFQPGCQIDGIAIQAAAVDDDVADIDADAEQHLVAFRQVERLLGKGALDLGCGAHGLHRAAELGHDGIARRAEDPAAELCDDPLDHGMTGAQRAVRALLVDLHEMTVARCVGRKYDRQASFHCPTQTSTNDLT